MPSDGFGILAPGAAQRTALEKQGGADTRPVMQAEPLNIENECLFFMLLTFIHGNSGTCF
jgi:hypothetical protein